MPASLEKYSKNRSWKVVVGAMRAHMGMKPAHNVRGPSLVAIFTKVSAMLL